MVDGTTFQVGISVGHHFASSSESDASEVIKNADVAMCQDKQLKHLRQGAPELTAANPPANPPAMAMGSAWRTPRVKLTPSPATAWAYKPARGCGRSL